VGELLRSVHTFVGDIIKMNVSAFHGRRGARCRLRRMYYDPPARNFDVLRRH